MGTAQAAGAVWTGGLEPGGPAARVACRSTTAKDGAVHVLAGRAGEGVRAGASAEGV